MKICYVIKMYLNDCTNILYGGIPNLLSHSPIIGAHLHCLQCFITINYILLNVFMNKSVWVFKHSLLSLNIMTRVGSDEVKVACAGRDQCEEGSDCSQVFPGAFVLPFQVLLFQVLIQGPDVLTEQ